MLNNIMIQEFLIITILISLLSSFIILFLKKTLIVNYFQINGSKFISDLFSCDFCLSWWICFFLCIITSITFDNYILILVSLFSTPLTRYFL